MCIAEANVQPSEVAELTGAENPESTSLTKKSWFPVNILVVGDTSIVPWHKLAEEAEKEKKNLKFTKDCPDPPKLYKFKCASLDCDLDESLKLAHKHIEDDTHLLVIALSKANFSYENGPLAFSYVKSPLVVGTLISKLKSVVSGFSIKYPKLKVQFIPPYAIHFENSNRFKMKKNQPVSGEREKFLSGNCGEFAIRYQGMLDHFVAELDKASLRSACFREGPKINSLPLEPDGITLTADSNELLWRSISVDIDICVDEDVLTCLNGKGAGGGSASRLQNALQSASKTLADASKQSPTLKGLLFVLL